MNADGIDPTDEALVAYVDGELDAAERARIDAVAQRPDVARRLAEFQRTRVALRRTEVAAPSFDGPLPRGMADAAAKLAAALEARAAADARTRAAAEAAPAPAPAPDAASRVVPLAPRARAARSAWTRWTGVGAALAASVTLVVALMLSRGTSSPAAAFELAAGDTVATDHPLYAAFERAPSATAVDLDGATARPWLTFRAHGGAPCREMEVATGSAATLAVACRERGGWRVVAAESGLARTAGADETFVPASAPESARVAAEIDRLIAGDALSAEEESKLLASGWE